MKKYKRFVTNVLCASMVLGNTAPALAATTESQEAGESRKTNVLYEQKADYSVTIPKTITLGADKQAAYSVKVDGDIPSDRQVSVSPIDGIDATDELDFYMHDQSTKNPKDDVTATVDHKKYYWNFKEAADSYVETENKVSAPGLTSGRWKGTFNFGINLENIMTDGIALSVEGDVPMGAKSTYQVNAYMDGEDVTEDVSWKSDNPDITVSSGLLETKASAQIGDTATITVEAGTAEGISLFRADSDNTLSADFTVTVIDIVFTTEDEAVTSLNIKPGESETIEAAIVPASAGGTVSWSTTAPAGLNLIPNGNKATVRVADDMPTGNTYDLVATYGTYSKLLKVHIAADRKPAISGIVDGGIYAPGTGITIDKESILTVNGEQVDTEDGKYIFEKEGKYEVVATDKEGNEIRVNITISESAATSIGDLVDGETYPIGTAVTTENGNTVTINGNETQMTDGRYVFEEDGTYEITVTDKNDKETTITINIAHEHRYEGIVTKEATYTESGIRTFTCNKCGDSYTETIPVLADGTAPTGSITVSDNVWKSLLNTITFNIFFREMQDVEIEAADDESGVKETAYYLADSRLDEGSLPSLAWNTYSGKLSISPNAQYVIYARITDNAGNVTYISSDGIVLDNVAPSFDSSVEDGGAYKQGHSIKIQDGETLKINGAEAETADGTYIFNEEGEYTITIVDRAGNESSITISIIHEHIYIDGICSCGKEEDPYGFAPDTAYADWTYTLNDADGTIVLGKYNGTAADVTVYNNYEVNGKVYKTKLSTGNHMFSYNTTVESIKFGDNIDISELQNMSYMFYGCSNLVSLDVNNLNTSSVTDMSNMFCGCSALTSLDVSNFDTSKVIGMSNMFSGCSGLTSLDVSKFNTGNVTSIGGMFSGCSGLTSLDVSNFDTTKVTGMNSMFRNCSGLTSLNVSKFNTSNVTNMNAMFSGCSGLTSLDVSNFDTTKVAGMSSMFENCSALTSLDVSNFNTSKVISMEDTFSGCSALTFLDVSSFDTSNVTSILCMFSFCSELTSLDLGNFNTRYVTNMQSMFFGCAKLTSLDLSSFKTDRVKKMMYMFKDCSELKTIYVDSTLWTTAKLTDTNDTRNMFDNCGTKTVTYK